MLVHLAARPLRLLGRVFGVRLEPQRISAEVEFTRPFETSSALAHADLREGRIGESSEDALAHRWWKLLTVVAPFAHVRATVWAAGSGAAPVMMLSNTFGIVQILSGGSPS